jgi:hypothetical protein
MTVTQGTFMTVRVVTTQPIYKVYDVFLSRGWALRKIFGNDTFYITFEAGVNAMNVDRSDFKIQNAVLLDDPISYNDEITI